MGFRESRPEGGVRLSRRVLSERSREGERGRGARWRSSSLAESDSREGWRPDLDGVERGVDGGRQIRGWGRGGTRMATDD